MLKAESYSIKGVKGTAVTLPSAWELKLVPHLLAQAIRVYEDRSHTGLAKAQNRSEVNRTTKKLYKQKGTGGARHGSRSAPIFVGGGVAHGPEPRKRELTLPQKIRVHALKMSLNGKAQEKKILVYDMAGLKKTNDTKAFLKKSNPEGKNMTFILGSESKLVHRALRNLKNTRVVSYKNINAYDVYFGGILVFDKSIFKINKKEKSK
jgi:large subunit ribosomal protein L4